MGWDRGDYGLLVVELLPMRTACEIQVRHNAGQRLVKHLQWPSESWKMSWTACSADAPSDASGFLGMRATTAPENQACPDLRNGNFLLLVSLCMILIGLGLLYFMAYMAQSGWSGLISV